ncbi:MAG: MFS transporter [Caulobacteraceae bacterium]|nr:MFS transporter [Caulobacteraceae bacterium]
MDAGQAISQMSPNRPAAADEWRAGWPVVAASFVGCAIAGMHLYAIGPLIRPLAFEFGWRRAQISVGVTLTTVSGVVAAPLVGVLVDKLGARRVALAGICLYAIGLVGVGLSGPSIWSWYLAWAYVAVVYFLTSSLVWALGVASRFHQSRGFALAAGNTGIAAASTLAPIVTVLISKAYSWRAVYFTLGGFAFVVGLATTWLLFFDAGDLIRVGRRSVATHAGHSTGEGVDLLQAIRSPTFWQLALAVLIFSYCSSTLVVHSQAILVDNGVKPGAAALYAMLAGPSLVVGRLSAGALLDKVHTRFVATSLFAFEAVAVLLLLNLRNTPTHLASIYIFSGLALGAEYDMLSYATSRYFGLRRYGSILGVLYGFSGVGAGLGPLAGGIIYDSFGGYADDLVGMIVVLTLGGILTAALVRYPRQLPVV